MHNILYSSKACAARINVSYNQKDYMGFGVFNGNILQKIYKHPEISVLIIRILKYLGEPVK